MRLKNYRQLFIRIQLSNRVKTGSQFFGVMCIIIDVNLIAVVYNIFETALYPFKIRNRLFHFICINT
ncbi:hypothetical protein D3C85_1680880 [compost metagenome]